MQIVYDHGKGGTAGESEHWFHTEEQMAFLDDWIRTDWNIIQEE
ncbi:hypothetical protein SAMN05216584_10580 [Selenomonas sp. WCT3]|nr:hypothetical protein SAMN05216584_10580 [Selenomonas ruminantium]